MISRLKQKMSWLSRKSPRRGHLEPLRGRHRRHAFDHRLMDFCIPRARARAWESLSGKSVQRRCGPGSGSSSIPLRHADLVSASAMPLGRAMRLLGSSPQLLLLLEPWGQEAAGWRMPKQGQHDEGGWGSSILPIRNLGRQSGGAGGGGLQNLYVDARRKVALGPVGTCGRTRRSGASAERVTNAKNRNGPRCDAPGAVSASKL